MADDSVPDDASRQQGSFLRQDPSTFKVGRKPVTYPAGVAPSPRPAVLASTPPAAANLAQPEGLLVAAPQLPTPGDWKRDTRRPLIASWIPKLDRGRSPELQALDQSLEKYAAHAKTLETSTASFQKVPDLRQDEQKVALYKQQVADLKTAFAEVSESFDNFKAKHAYLEQGNPPVKRNRNGAVEGLQTALNQGKGLLGMATLAPAAERDHPAPPAPGIQFIPTKLEMRAGDLNYRSQDDSPFDAGARGLLNTPRQQAAQGGPPKRRQPDGSTRHVGPTLPAGPKTGPLHPDLQSNKQATPKLQRH